MREHATTAIPAIALFALLTLASAGSVAGQRWSGEIAAGSTTHEALPGAPEALGATLGLRRSGPRWLYLSGGLPFDHAGVPWIAGGLGARWLVPASAALRVGADAAAQPYAFQDRSVGGGGHGATLEALPLVSITSRSARVELRSGIMHHAGSYLDSTSARTVHHSDVRAFATVGGLALAAEGRGVRAPEAFYPFLGGAVEAPLGDGSVWGSAGRWFGASLDDTEWGVGGRMPAGRLGEIHASFRREAEDPFLSSGPRTVWAVGLRRTLGAALAALPSRPAPVIRGTRVEFRLPVSDAVEPPSIGGDFTGWEAVPMRRQGSDWVVLLTVGPGVHRYAFRTAGGEWFVPRGVPGRVDDGFGGHAATLVVP